MKKIIIPTKSGNIQLSIRQSQCLYHLIHGHSAKETAKAIIVSHRTVEKHLEILKKRFNVRAKWQIICKIDSQNFLLHYARYANITTNMQ